MQGKTRFLIVVGLFMLASQWRTWLYYLNPPPDYSQGKVVLYATDWCPYCEKTRALLNAKSIPYREMNIETSVEANRQYRRLAGEGVPVLLVAGEVVRGYNEQRISALVEAWQQRQNFQQRR